MTNFMNSYQLEAGWLYQRGINEMKENASAIFHANFIWFFTHIPYRYALSPFLFYSHFNKVIKYM